MEDESMGRIEKYLNPILISIVGVLIWNLLTTTVDQLAAVSKENEANYRLLSDKIDSVSQSLSQKLGVINDRFSAQAERLTRVESRQDSIVERVAKVETPRPSNIPGHTK